MFTWPGIARIQKIPSEWSWQRFFQSSTYYIEGQHTRLEKQLDPSGGMEEGAARISKVTYGHLWLSRGGGGPDLLSPPLDPSMTRICRVHRTRNNIQTVRGRDILAQIYSKTYVKRPLSKRKKNGSQDQLSLIAGKRIAECSKGSIMQYFQPSLSYYLSLRPLFCLFWSGHFTQV